MPVCKMPSVPYLMGSVKHTCKCICHFEHVRVDIHRYIVTCVCVRTCTWVCVRVYMRVCMWEREREGSNNHTQIKIHLHYFKHNTVNVNDLLKFINLKHAHTHSPKKKEKKENFSYYILTKRWFTYNACIV